MNPTSFWSALESDKSYKAVPTAFASKASLDEVVEFQAPQRLVDEAMKQVRELHGAQLRPIPDPYVTYYKDWSKDPFGGGYHAWQANVSVQDTMRFMRCPISQEGIHICGDSYSDQQGWAEGALCEAEKMLQEHFGLDRPNWLSQNYYLGW